MYLYVLVFGDEVVYLYTKVQFQPLNDQRFSYSILKNVKGKSGDGGSIPDWQL